MSVSYIRTISDQPNWANFVHTYEESSESSLRNTHVNFLVVGGKSSKNNLSSCKTLWDKLSSSLFEFLSWIYKKKDKK